MNPSFDVPAQYFYALGVSLPPDVTPAVRYRLATVADEKKTDDQLRKGRDDGVIVEDAVVTIEMAGRRLRALGSAQGITPVCASGVGLALVQAYSAYTHPAPPLEDPAADVAPFWAGVMADANQAKAHLELILCAVAQEADSRPLITHVTAAPPAGEGLQLDSVKNLDPAPWGGPPPPGLDFGDWKKLFDDFPGDLPAITAPGTHAERIGAFVRRLKRFFDVATTGVGPPAFVVGAPPLLPLPSFDAIDAFFAAYVAQPGQGGFAWGDPFDEGALAAAIAAVALDAPGQRWLEQAVRAINALFAITDLPALTPGFRFTLVESLYARGFTSAADVAALSLEDFTDALLGTPAYPDAAALYARAGGAGGTPVPPVGPFAPINPDGNLTDCLPACGVSPLGPTGYLHDLLATSTTATCDDPGGESEGDTLADALDGRRGPLGDLAASCANAETPLPVIDLVNECLEAMIATGTPDGVVYDTAADEVAGHLLRPLDTPPDEDGVPFAHDPDKLFAALPEHSTPATPVAEPDAYSTLAGDFSSPLLPYQQPLDVNRSYLGALGSSRAEVMRRFCKEITEFVLDPENPSASFPSHLWRFPLRIEIALESLGITPAEHKQLFTASPSGDFPAQLYGFPPGIAGWTSTVVIVSELLERLGLSYCELVDLWRSAFVAFHVHDADTGADGNLPECEPCCLDELTIVFDGLALDDALARIAVFVRLWRKLQALPGARYTFEQLVDICDVLGLFDAGGVLNPDFVRQLAAFQVLRNHFHLPLADPSDSTPGTGADRTHLLALWALWSPDPPRKWAWAVEQLIDHVERHAIAKHGRPRRHPDFLKLLAENLDPLSRLCGFDPTVPERTWRHLPTHTLRFGEQLAKIYTSSFGVGEILYLFTADTHLTGDDPFPHEDANEALENPLEHPEDNPTFSLARLRENLLRVDVSDAQAEEWTWTRIATTMRDRFGYAPPAGTDPLVDFGSHFFPNVLEHEGVAVNPASRYYAVPLAGSNAAMWNMPDSPFTYVDGGAGSELRAAIPLRDEVVLEKLSRIRPLQGDEPQAVRDLYHAPRADLARFGYLFASPSDADLHLVEERDAHRRWAYFRHRFALFHERCEVIVRHLAEHVESVTGHEGHHTRRVAWVVLGNLLADQNAADPPPWESDAGGRPATTWGPPPVGGAFAALVGLVGTGLLGEYRVDGAPPPVWRELRGPFAPFGELRDEWNVPAPTIVPALDFDLSEAQKRWAFVRNGIALSDPHARRLGGPQEYAVTWTGALLVEHDGTYRFWAGAPTPEGEQPSLDGVRGRRWRVVIRRGQKEWVLLAHDWIGEADSHGSSSLPLRRGIYRLIIDYERCAPIDDDLEDAHELHTGFQLKYEGPDTEDELVTVPRRRLYVEHKQGTLADGIEDDTLTGLPREFLEEWYVSTLRDMRRTYERAFKALLFAHRFGLSADVFANFGQSELGYMLGHPDCFAGLSFYEQAGWQPHRAFFDFNLLPLGDAYFPPGDDDRADPSLKREQALFDIWERLFDYTVLRRHARRAPESPVWLLFDEAAENQPDNPAQLLRHMDVDPTHADRVLAYDPGYPVTADDLMDERWAVRVWHADRLLRHMVERFEFVDVRDTRPDLWAADDPGAPGAGNENLTKVVSDGYIENGRPRRYEDLERLNDGLRERARAALLAFLCGMDRVALPWPGSGFATRPKELSELLLIDVEAGVCERASRVEEAVTAVQTFVQRARLGLEPPWNPGVDFTDYWDGRFQTFRIWQACVRRELYREDWIEWNELEAARRTEAFRFLEDRLRRVTLTIPVPGGLEFWPADLPAPNPGLDFLQVRDPSALRLLDGPREGLNLLGTPERSGQRSWLAPIPSSTQGNGNGNGDGNGGDDGDGGGDGDGGPEIAHTFDGEAIYVPPTQAWRKLPLWIEAAIRLGVRFLRVPAAGVPPASRPFAPRSTNGDACCDVCGRSHQAVVDEYYFWLVDTRWSPDFTVAPPGYDDVVEQDPDWPGWHDPTSLPELLQWPAKPMVHLMWCHVHDGEIMQPRRSTEGVPVPDDTAPGTTELALTGRKGDSLLFTVAGGLALPGYAATPLPGFRYDLAADDAVVEPGVVAEPAGPTFLGSLTAYPYFAYFAPGAPLFPLTPYGESFAVAGLLRGHCRFEQALKWYELVFDPLTSDNRWCLEPPGSGNENGNGDGNGNGHHDGPVPEQPPVLVEAAFVGGPPSLVRTKPGCCRHTEAPDEVARRRAVTLDYLETLLVWGDCLMRRNSPEAFQQARLVYDTAAKVLGPTPRLVRAEAVDETVTVADFVADTAPLNPRLMSLYERVGDRLSLVHACLNGRRRRNGRPRVDMPYFGDDPARDGWQVVCDGCGCDVDECCCPVSPYRFTFLVQKAVEVAAEVRALGAELLAAFEKGDAEYLVHVRARHEHQILSLGRAIRQEQWRAADWDVQALQKTKEIAQTNRRYYNDLVTRGLIAGELDYEDLTSSAIGSIDSATVNEAIGTVLGVIPDVFVGTVDFAQLAIGSKLAGVFQGIARISSEVAQILTTTAGLRLQEAGWQRRDEEWRHQVEIFDLEIEQIERQILSAERRRAAALRELDSQQRQIENASEVLEALRAKFTSQALYLWLQRELASLYYQAYELGRCVARQAERAFNYERGYTTRRFLPAEAWDDLREGLLAGERLGLGVRQMEQAYLNENVREYELTRHLSLRLCFSHAFLALKLTGRCVLEIPEWLFDLDYPGQYMRRIKSVSLTIPAVVGPYTGVHCRVTLLSSGTRIDPRLHGPVAPCCPEPPEPKPEKPPCGCWPAPRPMHVAEPHDPAADGYAGLPDDPRIVRHYAATEAIATSSGQNDTGMFELNFRDERYLPFEFAGAVSRWRIELPPETNYFDLDTVSDVVLHVNYTAREGGEILRQAAFAAAQDHLPDGGKVTFDLKHDMPDEWSLFTTTRERCFLELRLSKDRFPFATANRDLFVTGFDLFVEGKGAEPSTHREVEFIVAHEPGCHHAESDEYEFQCVGGAAWPGFFHGQVDVNVGPIENERLVGTFHFEEPVEHVTRAFLVVRYESRRVSTPWEFARAARQR